ncbi:unnamed protein product [Effrenium voratum]|uniref:S-adenosyl-methyltransferase MraW n=1 Tax=Effrenium voratum TaxID=2562239 RepID=A0AA36IN53_9DINO|nr:unnamed protein product [Effrenium voratum]
MQSGFEPLAAEVKPLLLHESVELLMQVGGPAAVYVDGSFGQGGHSAEILRHLAPEGRLVALDVNQKAEAARSLSDARLRFVQRSCRDLCQLFGEEEPAGVLLDLSVQLSAQEERAKGLSFQADALDGRLTPWARRADEWLKQVRGLVLPQKALHLKAGGLLAPKSDHHEAALAAQRFQGAHGLPGRSVWPGTARQTSARSADVKADPFSASRSEAAPGALWCPKWKMGRVSGLK